MASVDNSTQRGETSRTTVTNIVTEQLAILGVAIFAGVAGFALFGVIYWLVLRNRRRERFPDYEDRESALPPIIIHPGGKISHIDTE